MSSGGLGKGEDRNHNKEVSLQSGVEILAVGYLDGSE